MVTIAAVGLVILLGLSLFQFLLALGRPIGEFAWGGQHRILPRRLRVASALSIVLYAIFALFLASAAGVVNVIPESPLLDVGMWVLTAYFILGIVMNAISRSKKERYLMTPVVLVLAIVFLTTAINM